jgi:nucleotidyltransferase/DNA polymerase involved in DNA repair
MSAKSLPVNGLPLHNKSVDDLLTITPPANSLPVDNLPLHALAAARPHLDTLSRLGVTTWSQLRALPRGGVSRRFGAPLLDALDQAYGLRPDLYPWLLLPDAHSTGDSLGQMLERLSARLGADQVLQLQARWDHRPEQMQAWQAVASQSIATHAYDTRARVQKGLKNTNRPVVAPNARPGADSPPRITAPLNPWAQPLAPSWLLQVPLKLALRDYFVAYSAQAGLLWIYRERLSGADPAQPSVNWCLHGLFA